MITRQKIETLFFSHLDSPIGLLTVVVSAKGLVAIDFAGAAPAPQPVSSPKTNYVEDQSVTAPYVEQLEAYFRGDLREFTFPLDLRGTDFQLSCWRALLGIPYGQTRSYADIARAVGRPAAFRAVGMANHSNPIPIVVPCHRVLASDGTLCGYGGGLDIKRKLLELEGCELEPAKLLRN